MNRDVNPNKLNIYICEECGNHVVTRDMVEDGVTPFLIRCKYGCHAMMQSSIYRVFDPGGKMNWEYEWYRPGQFEEVDVRMLDHVSNGGLLLRLRATHEHIKGKGLYRVVSQGHFNISNEDEWGDKSKLDRAEVTIYRGEEGQWQVRLSGEFNDGRFREIK